MYAVPVADVVYVMHVIPVACVVYVVPAEYVVLVSVVPAVPGS